MEKCQKLTKGHNFVKIMIPANLTLHAQLQFIAKHSAKYQVSLVMNTEEMVGTESMSSWAATPTKNIQIKILKPHAHLCIIGRKSIKFPMSQMKDVEGVEETKCISEWVITLL